MKIKRFHAKDMRAAFKMVREEQGPNAVILSSRQMSDGIEVIAATDYDEALVQQALKATQKSQERKNAYTQDSKIAYVQAQTIEHKPATRVVNKVQKLESQQFHELRKEISDIRTFFEREMSRIYIDRVRTTPLRAKLLDECMEYGCDVDFSTSLISATDEKTDERKARGQMLGMFAKSISVTHRDLIAQGGMFAIVGSTGVGKTTTIAKLAARFARKYSPRDVALVTIDTYRIGARDQLYTFGRLIGVPVFEAGSYEALADVLARLVDYKLVLVDTAGMSHRDKNLLTQLTWINRIPGLQSILALPANAQSADLNDMIHCFETTKPHAVVLTKLDETRKLGTALSTIIKHQMPIAYVTDGQRVPEDLHVAEPHKMVLRTTELLHAGIIDSHCEETACVAA